MLMVNKYEYLPYSWKAYCTGMLLNSRIRWWWTLLCGSNLLYSARLLFSCHFSPLQHTPSWRVSWVRLKLDNVLIICKIRCFKWHEWRLVVDSSYYGHIIPAYVFVCLIGGCKWIRTPAIIYSVHVATTLIPILSHVLFNNFPLAPHPGPQTLQERLTLVSIYAPYLIIPVMILCTMLFSSTYNSTSPKGNTSSKSKKQR